MAPWSPKPPPPELLERLLEEHELLSFRGLWKRSPARLRDVRFDSGWAIEAIDRLVDVPCDFPDMVSR